MIQVRAVRKTFQIYRKEPGFMGSVRALIKPTKVNVDALKEVSCEISPGEIVGLVGANGAGKTTLVKILAGIIYPTSGDASVLGYRPWERRYAFRKQVALIMGQKAQLWWDLPAADCFLLLKEIYEIPSEVYKRNVTRLTEMLDVARLLTTPIRRLSLGERMKMELVAALLHQPKVVYLDEPTIGLDITSQRTIRQFLLDYLREEQPAMILTSHYMEDIKALCERIIVIREGSFVYDGPTDKVGEAYKRYKIIALEHSDASIDLASVQHLGEVLNLEPGYLRIRVETPKLPAALQTLLAQFPTTNVEIEEEDFGALMENLMVAHE